MLAYDFKDGKLIWILNGYGKMQHDIDVLDNEGTYISFDNNALEVMNQKEIFLQPLKIFLH